MNEQSPLFRPDSLREHESGVRRMMAESRGESYVAFQTLAVARTVPDSIAVLEGDDGGQIYLVAPVADVRCTEEALQLLLRDLDALEWDDPSAARVFYERRPSGGTVGGGMGGGHITEGVWVHPRLVHLTPTIAAVLKGERDRI